MQRIYGAKVTRLSPGGLQPPMVTERWLDGGAAVSSGRSSSLHELRRAKQSETWYILLKRVEKQSGALKSAPRPGK